MLKYYGYEKPKTQDYNPEKLASARTEGNKENTAVVLEAGGKGKTVDDTFGDVSCIMMAPDTHNVGILDEGEDLNNLQDNELVKGSPVK